MIGKYARNLMQYYPHLLTSCKASRRAISSTDDSRHPIHNFKAGDPCYTLYFGPKQTKDPRWVPAVVVERTSSRTIQVRTVPQGSIWRRHIDQLRPRYPLTEDDEPGEDYILTLTTPQILNKLMMHQNLPLKMNQNLQFKYLRTFTRLWPF